jgi:hypothetical protein
MVRRAASPPSAEGCRGWIATALPGRVRVLARLASDYGDPLRSRYEHVDYESTCIDCRKIGGSPQPYLNGVFRLGFNPRTMAIRNDITHMAINCNRRVVYVLSHQGLRERDTDARQEMRLIWVDKAHPRQ